MKNDLFDNRIKEKLEGHEAPVPADAWANIQKGKKKRRPLPFFWLLAGLLLCGGAGLYLLMNESRNNMLDGNKSKGERNSLTNNKIEKTTATIKDIAPQKNKGEIAINDKINDTGSQQKIPSSEEVNDNNHTAVSTVMLHNKKDDKHSQQQHFENSKGKTSFAITVPHDTGDEVLSNPKRSEKSSAGKLTMTLEVPDGGTDENDTTTIVFKQQEPVCNVDSIVFPVNKESGEIAINGKQADTAVAKTGIETTDTKIPAKTKKKKAGLQIDMSISGFMPSANKANITTISRISTESLHKAEFTANYVRVQLQPSVGFNFLFFKPLTAKLAVGAGLSYQVIKEYIRLRGEEINTNQTIVKRLNSNILIDDTVTTVTKGIRNIDAVNSYTLWSIPVSFRYQLWQRSRWTMDMQAGIDINLQSKYKNSIGGQLVPQFSNAGNAKRNNKIGTGFNLGLRMSRRVGKDYILYAAPYLQLNPTTLYLEEMLAPTAINRAGISVGVTYGL